MKIYIGTDHAGLAQKERIVEYLKNAGYEVVDCGAHEYDEGDDYPDYIIPVARAVSQNPNNVKGIILGGSGQGEAMTANRFLHVRASVFYGDMLSISHNVSILEFSRKDNDANILSIGARFVSDDQAVEAVRAWLDMPFSNNERHKRRIQKMDKTRD